VPNHPPQLKAAILAIVNSVEVAMNNTSLFSGEVQVADFIAVAPLLYGGERMMR
jgi:hypothetical protein